jgi:hypothetical protein
MLVRNCLAKLLLVEAVYKERVLTMVCDTQDYWDFGLAIVQCCKQH